MNDTEEKITKHLFLLSPNNCGSSYINECFKNSKDIAALENEGQDESYFFGKKTADFEENISFIFTKKARDFEDDDYVQWVRTEAAWTEKWELVNPNAQWRFQKSPPDILRPHILLDVFVNLSFLIMARNPYAMAESIIRSNPTATLEDIANHCIDCLIAQRKNNYLMGNNFCFTYEDMCDRPEWVEKNIKEKYNIEDFSLTLPKKHKIKNKYDSILVNKNEEQINRLKKHQIEFLNSVFKKYMDTMDYWGYTLLDEKESGFYVNQILEIDNSKLKEKVLSIEDSYWSKQTDRQEYFVEHDKTESIILFSKPEGTEDPIYGKEQIVDKELMLLFKEDFSDLFIKLKTHFFNSGEIGRILLAKLKPNCTIPPHQDHGPHLEKCRRLHIPLITNDNVDFIVDDKSHNLKEGFVYEFDNTRTHHVTNNSDEERIHLIVDWIY